MYSSALLPQPGLVANKYRLWNWAVLLYLLAIASAYGALFLSGPRSGPSSVRSFFWAFDHLTGLGRGLSRGLSEASVEGPCSS